MPYHLMSFKCERAGRYGVLWVFASKEAITEDFGLLDNPKWPKAWLHYESDVLTKFFDWHPDTVDFTDCAILAEYS